jgi:hypothetical protein
MSKTKTIILQSRRLTTERLMHIKHLWYAPSSMILPGKHLQMIKDLISGMRIGESLYFQFDDLLLESDRLNA